MASASRWKNQEREIARALGTERIPNSGYGQPDVRVPGYAIQVKTKKVLPAWLMAFLDQATRDAGPGETPVVVISEVSQGKKARRLVLMHFEDWVNDVNKDHEVAHDDHT
jgi:hypothetical protein